MTIVVAVVTGNGLVLASDSATTQQLQDGSGNLRTSSIWNSANKIVNLRKTWPVGAMTFGRASFKGRSVATHCKDLRLCLSGDVTDEAIPPLMAEDFTVEAAARAVHTHFRELYDDEPGGMLGFLVGGIGAHEVSPELWQVMISDGEDDVTQLLPPGEIGIFHQGMTDAIARLVDGASQGLGEALTHLGVPEKDAEPAAEAVRGMLTVPMAWQGMPLGETIDLARFLVDTTINFVRFSPGDASVGGPIEIAVLTKHEGYKWVQRKHHYRLELNPEEEVN